MMLTVINENDYHTNSVIMSWGVSVSMYVWESVVVGDGELIIAELTILVLEKLLGTY